jgi:hypothetical protein
MSFSQLGITSLFGIYRFRKEARFDLSFATLISKPNLRALLALLAALKEFRCLQNPSD